MPQPPFDVEKTTSAALSPTSELPWTGERLVPSQTGQIAAEHLHRYAIAGALAQGKDVLDIACGEGYGSALLGRTARSVVGVDIDPETVRHADRKYGSSKVRFLRGDCRAIPLADASVDLVVSFETLEHIHQQDDFLDGVRRVLRSGGLLIISTPEKQNYGDTRDTDNPFHVRELSSAEFRDVLTARFKHVCFLGQRFAAVSLVFGNTSTGKWGMFTGDYRASEVSDELAAPTYLLAVCADEPLPPLPVGAFEFDQPPASHVAQPQLFAQVSGGDGGDHGERSIKQAVISGAWQIVRFEHVERLQPDGQGRLRVAPVNTTALLEVASIRVIRDADQATVYGAQSAAEFTSVEFSNLRAYAGGRNLFLLTAGPDPHFSLPPLGDFNGAAHTLELTVRLETTFDGIVQSHGDLLQRSHELAEAVGSLQTRVTQWEAADLAWRQSLADLRTALEASRTDCGRLESQKRQLETGAAGLRDEADAVRRELHILRRSLSWQVTVPLRSVQRFLAKQRRSLRKRRAEIRELFVRAAVRMHPTRRLKELRRLAKLVGRSNLVDKRWYRSQYKRQVPKTADPVLHYLRYGLALECDPNPFFASRYYWEANPDVAAVGTNPLVHYILYGWREGRDPSPAFSLRDYLQANPDVANRGQEPLAHYLRRWRGDQGIAEPQGDSGSIEVERARSLAEETVASRERHETTTADGYEGPRPLGDHAAPVKLIAFYLPQFHPIPENDRWWGDGFTEWRNVVRAEPWFEGHYQPRLPGALGFYDLRLKEVMQQQIELARQFGIYGFCFHHYWFGGRRLLERPVEQLLADPGLSMPFCVCWANENWTRRWDGWESEILIAQQHSAEDDLAFIRDVQRYFRDPRYIRIDSKPLLIVYRPQILPDAAATLRRWRAFCEAEGSEIYCVAAQSFGLSDAGMLGFDAAVQFPPHNFDFKVIRKPGLSPAFHGKIHDYEEWSREYLKPSPNNSACPLFRCVCPSWDNTARRGANATVFADSTPDKYARWLDAACRDAYRIHAPDRRFVFLNAWNEWAEGAHLEPDLRFGYAYLNRTAEVLRQLPAVTAPASGMNAADERVEVPDQPHGSADVTASAAGGNAVVEERRPGRRPDAGQPTGNRLRRRYRHLFEPTAQRGGESLHISIIIPVFNRAELTLECLSSLHSHSSKWPREVIVVDDGSSDATQPLLSQLPGVRYVRSDQNRGFVAACNDGAQQARGEFLVFLNNDTIVRDGWLDALRETFLLWPNAGLVGSKLVLPSGRLQECGSLLFRDGSAANYGRDGDPADPRYCFVRETDYVSGAAIMIRRELFVRLGAFDARYAPAYFEDTDLAMRVREAGFQVLVNPHAVVLHREGGTAGTDLSVGVKRYQAINQVKFFERWHAALESYPDREAVPQWRSRGPRILVIDWTIPRPDRDSGSVRMAAILRILREVGFQITFAARDLSYDAKYAPELERLGIEIVRREYVDSLRRYIEQSRGAFAYVVISRRDTAKLHMDMVRELCPTATVIFDTVDLHFLREARERALESHGGSDAAAERNRIEELALVKRADVTVVVSADEREVLRATVPDRDVCVVSNIHEAQPTPRLFRQRSGIIFIGYFLHKPNVDGLLWFVREVLPLLEIGADDCKLHVVGSDPPKEVQALASDEIQIHGFVPNVTPLFDACRLSIAPLRYGAGVKGKIGQSLALGVPCVMTSIAAEGMGIRDGESGLIADTPAELARKVRQLYSDEQRWETLRRGGIDLIERSFSVDAARRELRELFRLGTMSGAPRGAMDVEPASTDECQVHVA